MVLSLVELCAKEVVRDHSSSPQWLCCVPKELYRSLLEAAFSSCRPLAVGELVQRWPERSLRVGGRTKPGHNSPNRLCIQALLLAVVRGLADQSSSLQMLDLSGLQSEEGGGGGCAGEPMGGWSLTVALCTAVLQAHRAQRGVHRGQGPVAAVTERASAAKKRGGGRGKAGAGGDDDSSGGEGDWVQGVRRRMELQRKSGGEVGDEEEEGEGEGVALHVCADLFVNARSWARVRLALSCAGPLRLRCRRLRVEELPAAAIGSLLDLLPRRPLLALDLRYSNLGLAGLGGLLPRLAERPALGALRLHYCGLDASAAGGPGQQGALQWVALGLQKMRALRSLSLTAVRLPGKLCTLLSALAPPLEELELSYVSLQPCDLAYLSHSHHAPALRLLALSDEQLVLDGPGLPSLRRLLSRAAGGLRHLALSGCGLTHALLGPLLPALCACRSLESLALAPNPLALAGLLELVHTAACMPRLRRLLYPNPLEDAALTLPPQPPPGLAAAELAARGRLHRMLEESCRPDLFLTCDQLSYDRHLAEQLLLAPPGGLEEQQA